MCDTVEPPTPGRGGESGGVLARRPRVEMGGGLWTSSLSRATQHLFRMVPWGGEGD